MRIPRRVLTVTASAAVLTALSTAPAVAAPQGHGPHAGNCRLVVPANPLTPAGLAAPYRLAGGCRMSDSANEGAFVQATVVAPDGRLLVYDPLVITAGTSPAAPPVVPVLPAGSVTGIWAGFNGSNLKLTGPGAAGFVQGVKGSPFGQVSYDNAPAFFAAAAGKAVIPPLGTGLDGLPCPSTRDFSLVDQDPSDNVTTQYLQTADGRTAQDTRANAVALGGAAVIGNGSDNRLLTHFVDPALGCVPFTAPDLADNMTPATSQGLDELQAAAYQANPALVPVNDPMTTVGAGAGQYPVAANLSAAKTGAYRAGVGQPPVTGNLTAAATAFCNGLKTIAGPRLAADAPFETGRPSPAAGQDLHAFMLGRLASSLTLLNCPLFR